MVMFSLFVVEVRLCCGCGMFPFIRFCINRLGLAVYIQIYIHKVFDESSYYIGVGIIFAIIV